MKILRIIGCCIKIVIKVINCLNVSIEKRNNYRNILYLFVGFCVCILNSLG